MGKLKARLKRRKIIIIGIAVIMLICLGLYKLNVESDRWWSEIASVDSLARALNMYHQLHKTYPENLESIVKDDAYGLSFKSSIENGKLKIDGVTVEYVMATRPGFIVAVFYFDDGEVGYVRLGLDSESAFFSDKKSIQYVLQEDNARRTKHNEPNRWPVK